MAPIIVWFRLDLRLADNPALHAAAQAGGAVLPVFIDASQEETPWQPGAASRWWLHHSLIELDANLHQAGSRLVIRHGPALEAILELAQQTQARAVFWNRRYEPAVIGRDNRLKESLGNAGLEVRSFNAALLHEPWTIRNQSGRPFQVFTPFWKQCLAQPDPSETLAAAKQLSRPNKWPHSLSIKELELEPRIDWAGGLRDTWMPGEAGARSNLVAFLKNSFADYSAQRNLPGIRGTSRLSPHLHFGEISPRQVWQSLSRMAAKRGLTEIEWRQSQFLTEIGWREFAHHLLHHFPHTPLEPLRPEFKNFPWRKDRTDLVAWQKGLTGFPIVDAGMRELWKTGWMHNRVRMIVASFLVKDLLLPWQYGARWFWDTLVDADLANNTLGWQWTTGCGADAAPYFRVFNPAIQGEKFDPHGTYVRHWCPEISRLPDKWLHRPEAAPANILHEARVELGRTYPKPIVSHSAARQTALRAFERSKPKFV
jgi:deoxyribodipyrimidine photo-lyase